MNIKISADSTCDLSHELIERYQIGIAPLYIVRDGESLVDGVDITPDQIYDHVSKSGSMCSTAAVSVYDYVTFFRKELETCDAVVHFHISEDMSACYQNACIAAAEVGNVYPVDSRNLSTGIGLLVLEAAESLAKGMSVEDTLARVEHLRATQLGAFVIRTLEFLRKGGRIGLVEGVVTGLVVVFLHQVRPELLEAALENKSAGVSAKKVIVTLAVVTVVVAGALSLVASSNPDGLEWAIGKTTQSEEELEPEAKYAAAAEKAGAVVDATAILPDYAFAGDEENPLGTTVSGLVGGAICVVLAGGVAWLTSAKKRRKVNA